MALKAEAESLLSRKYEVGSTDCASLSMRLIQSMYEEDLFSHLPPVTRSSMAEMALGYPKALESLPASIVSPLHATCGDLIVSEVDGEVSFGVLLRNVCITSHADSGVYVYPMKDNENFTVYRFYNGKR
jgi:hypothetical protein